MNATFLRLLVCVMLLGAASARPAHAAEGPFWHGSAADGTPTVRLHYFYSPTCPHCRAAKPVLDDFEKRFPWLDLTRYSIKDNPDNARLYFQTAKQLGDDAMAVPGFVFCGKLRVGFDTAETTGVDLARELEACYAERLKAASSVPPTGSAIARADPPGSATPATTSGDHGASSIAPEMAAAAGAPSSVNSASTYVPFIGKVDAQQWSLPVLTLVLAAADAFNPCAFFVLLFLLSLLVHARNRRRMLLIGGTFVVFSGGIYFLFMAAWLNLFLWLGELRVVTLLAGALALVVGALNVKDYFLFRQGPSLSIPESAKPGLFRRMRQVVAGGALAPMMFSTVVLALVANSYELLCTAGFPMVYTRALTLADLHTWQHYVYLAFYNVIYVLPLLAIVLVFTYTMGARKLTESEGRTLKLTSGFMMLGFGVVLLAAPHLLTNAVASLAVLGAALGLTALVVLAGRAVPAQR